MLTTLQAALAAATHMARDLWDLLTGDPVVFSALLMAAAAVLALVLIATPAKRTTLRQRKAPPQRPAAARSLAASGTPMGEISRRTGLSRDAVAMLLVPVPADSARKGQPLPARFAARAPSRGDASGDQPRA